MICGSRIPRRFRKGKSAVQYLPPLPKGCELSKACRSAVLFLNLMGLSVRKIATTLAISKKALESTLTRQLSLNQDLGVLDPLLLLLTMPSLWL